MKSIDHNYWTGKYRKDADLNNPFLRIAMQQLYGRGRFDFGKNYHWFGDGDVRYHCTPDGYSTYTSLENYGKKIPFMLKVVEENKELADRCRSLAGTIAGELFFPVHRLNGQTVNQARGGFGINDMMYRVLESIRLYYENEKGYYPLKDPIERYGYFFDEFCSFKGYLKYNFLQDYDALPKKFPTDEKELIGFWEGSIKFLEERQRKIGEYAELNGLFDDEEPVKNLK